MSMKSILIAAAVFLVTPWVLFAQSTPMLTPLVNQPPDGIRQPFLLTDGTVLAQEYVNPAHWWMLSPDIDGSYIKGTWKKVASLPSSYAPIDFASAVLADGRLLVIGGEFTTPSVDFTLTNKGAIYDPRSNVWIAVKPPEGFLNIGDSPSVVLPDGEFLIGDKLNEKMSELDPETMEWKAVGSTGKSDFNAEEGWTLLPDGTVLTADVKDAPNSEIYRPWSQEWVSAGSTIVDLHSPSPIGCLKYPPDNICYYPPGEIGPAILRPDGTVFATGSYANNDRTFDAGSAGHTAIFDTHSNKWAVGPDFPVTKGYGDNAGDEFAVLLPNGKVLVEGQKGWGYEFDGTDLTLTTTADLGSLTVLPTGEVLAGGGAVAFSKIDLTQVYISPGTYKAGWAPKISRVQELDLKRGETYRIWGTQFNGLSQAQAFGDENQAPQNYPLVRIANKTSNHVFYARTHDHSTMGVATGDEIVFTNFDVPPAMETGESTLVVVANGIPSEAVDITVE